MRVGGGGREGEDGGRERGRGREGGRERGRKGESISCAHYMDKYTTFFFFFFFFSIIYSANAWIHTIAIYANT